MVENDDLPMLEREATEAALELVPVGEDPRAVRDTRLGRDPLDVRLMPPQAGVLVRRGAHQDPVQPPVEPVDVAQLRELAPATDEGFLDGVLGKIGVAQHKPGDRQQPTDLGGGKLTERLPVAASRSLHELLPHVDHRARAGRSAGV